jgi:hypothetical protein
MSNPRYHAANPARRVVTGHAANGRSIIVSDGAAPRAVDFDHVPGMSNELIWGTDGQGQPVDDTTQASSLSYVPEVGGTRMMIVRFPPDTVFADPKFDGLAAAAEQAALLPGLAARFETEHPGFHRTPTIDYGVVLDGEILLELDDGVTASLKTGDVVVQNATRHAWRNCTDKPATMAFVLIGVPASSALPESLSAARPTQLAAVVARDEEAQ